MDCVYDEVGRWYRQENGLYYPSVTTVIGWHKKDKLAQWEASVGTARAEEIKRMAADRGTAVHELAENYIKNPKTFSTQNQSRLVKISFGKIKIGIDTMIPLESDRVVVETPLVSHRLKVAGRCDVMSPLASAKDGDRYIIDFKTSEKERKDEWNVDYFTQLSGYSIMHEEMSGERIEDLLLIFSIDSLSVPVYRFGVASEYRDKFETLVKEFHDNVKGPLL